MSQNDQDMMKREKWRKTQSLKTRAYFSNYVMSTFVLYNMKAGQYTFFSLVISYNFRRRLLGFTRPILALSLIPQKCG
jgi:hypothetical protein